MSCAALFAFTRTISKVSRTGTHRESRQLESRVPYLCAPHIREISPLSRREAGSAVPPRPKVPAASCGLQCTGASCACDGARLPSRSDPTPRHHPIRQRVAQCRRVHHGSPMPPSLAARQGPSPIAPPRRRPRQSRRDGIGDVVALEHRPHVVKRALAPIVGAERLLVAAVLLALSLLVAQHEVGELEARRDQVRKAVDAHPGWSPEDA